MDSTWTRVGQQDVAPSYAYKSRVGIVGSGWRIETKIENCLQFFDLGFKFVQIRNYFRKLIEGLELNLYLDQDGRQHVNFR